MLVAINELLFSARLTAVIIEASIRTFKLIHQTPPDSILSHDFLLTVVTVNKSYSMLLHVRRFLNNTTRVFLVTNVRRFTFKNYLPFMLFFRGYLFIY